MTKAKGGEREAHSCVSVIRFPDKTGNKKNLDFEKIGLYFRDKVVIVLVSKHANDRVLLFFFFFFLPQGRSEQTHDL